jgi:hypothetical protein
MGPQCLRWRLCSSLTHVRVRSLRCSVAAFALDALRAAEDASDHGPFLTG